MIDLRRIHGLVSDMDGVLWRGEDALPGLAEFVSFLAERGIKLVLATNNSGKSTEEYAAKLARMGVPDIAPQQIVTSRIATQSHLRRHYQSGERFYCIGSPGLIAAIEQAGLVFDEQAARVVVVGIDTDLTYRKLGLAGTLIRSGADFIGTNGDMIIPHGTGFLPGNGSILAALSAATARQPLIIGKPGRPMFEAALAQLGTPPAQTLMIGDRLDTDIAGADAAGLATGLMLTGVTDLPQLAAWQGSPPDQVFGDLVELRMAWSQV